jgi:hypothetical protein
MMTVCCSKAISIVLACRLERVTNWTLPCTPVIAGYQSHVKGPHKQTSQYRYLSPVSWTSNLSG